MVKVVYICILFKVGNGVWFLSYRGLVYNYNDVLMLRFIDILV